MKPDVFQKIIFIVGATAVGKTQVALKLAERLSGEIVSCDSMQVYREISIASSKPLWPQRQHITHHLLDVVSVEDKFDVAAFNVMARCAVDAILKNNKIPLIVGGSGMYMQVLLDGIFTAGGDDTGVRQKLQFRALNQGADVLYDELKHIDPDAAAKIHAHDLRRIVRALEVFQTTKTPISQLQKDRSGLWGRYPVVVFGLARERGELYERINTRVDQMFQEGLLEEVKMLKDRQLSLTARRIIGVREVLAYLRGECDLTTAKEQMKMNTRRLAKRQLTWFRKDKRINWLEIKQDDNADIIADKILKEISQ